MKNKLIIIVVLLAVLALMLIFFTPYVKEDTPTDGGAVFCTMDALVCPNGDGVGRSGPECTFESCAGSTFTGVFQQVGEGYQLVVATPEEIVGGVTYTIPLELTDSISVEALLGEQVHANGSFLEGNLFRVESMEKVNPQYDAPVAQIGVGESALVGYVRVTLNSVVQDSRCPVDVQCIQAGNIVVNVTLESDTDTLTTTIASDAAPITFDAFRISIADVAPESHSTKEIEESQYRIVFKVESIDTN
ncbi:MAG: hypothetical protein ACJKTH_01900 [Patescibacteria group bacterium UBA2163]